MARQQDSSGGTAKVLVREPEEAMGGVLQAEVGCVMFIF